MKAVQYGRYGGPDVLEVVDLPEPDVGPGQVRIRVKAAGISATDPKIRAGELPFGGDLPKTIGADVAGVVDQVGAGITDVTVGDQVFGVSDTMSAAAELTLLTHYATIPEALGFVDAAALPVALETATRALDQLGVADGTTLFVNGATGGIGSTVVQLAVARGARVIGTSSAANNAYVRSLGAEPIHYGDGMWTQLRDVAPGGVDAALDVVGNGVLGGLVRLTGSPARVITLADIAGADQHGVHFSNGFSDGHAFHALREIGDLIIAGRFWLPVDRTFPLDQIAEAHRVSETGRVRGRLVLTIPGPSTSKSLERKEA